MIAIAGARAATAQTTRTAAAAGMIATVVGAAAAMGAATATEAAAVADAMTIEEAVAGTATEGVAAAATPRRCPAQVRVVYDHVWAGSYGSKYAVAVLLVLWVNSSCAEGLS